MTVGPHARFVRCLSALFAGLLMCISVGGEVVTSATQNAPPTADDWERLQTLRKGTDVRFDFVDGSRLEGRLIRVSADAIELKLAQEWRLNGQATYKKNSSLEVTLTYLRRNVSGVEVSPLGGMPSKPTSRASASEGARAAQEPASPVTPTASALTDDPSNAAMVNADVVEMVRAGIGDAVIIAAIQNAKTHAFDVRPGALVDLKKAGVSDVILAVLLDTHAPQTLRSVESATPNPPKAKDAPEQTQPALGNADKDPIPDARSAGTSPSFSRSQLKRYRQIQVSDFDVSAAVNIPDQYLELLSNAVIDQLRQLKRFSSVVGPREDVVESSGPTITLVGTVTEFQAGNRAVRYLVGFGAGKTKVVAHVKLIDKATDTIMLEDDVDGKVILGGVVAGESSGAASGLAKEIAKVIKQRFF